MTDAQHSLSKKIIRNTLFNTIGRFWAVLVALFLTPYIIRYIGLERFGIWSIIGVLTGYFGLLDFGIGTSFVKYLAEFHAKGEHKKISAIVNTGFVFYSLLAVAVVVVVSFFMNPIVSFFKIPGALRGEAAFVLMVGVLLFCASNALSGFAAVQTGLQRMDISNKVSIFASTVNMLGTFYFLKNGYGLPGLMVNNVVTFCLTSIVNVFIALRLIPTLRFNPFLFDRDIFSRLFKFGYKLQISRFANLISFQNDKLLISYFLGVAPVTFYQIGSSLLTQVRQIPLLLISALVPAASEIEARKQKQYLVDLYLKGSKYLIFVAVPLMFLAMTDASLIISAWMGEGYRLAVVVIRVLALGYLAATITGVASSIAMGVAKTEMDMKFGIFMATLNIILNIILVLRIGFIGILIGTSISLFTASAYYLRMFHRYLMVPLRDFLRLLVKPVAACVVPVGAIIIFNHFFFSRTVFGHRLIYFVFLSVETCVFAVLYLLFISWSRYFDEQDRGLLKGKIPLFERFIDLGRRQR